MLGNRDTSHGRATILEPLEKIQKSHQAFMAQELMGSQPPSLPPSWKFGAIGELGSIPGLHVPSRGRTRGRRS